jgi:hypothetical protein
MDFRSMDFHSMNLHSTTQNDSQKLVLSENIRKKLQVCKQCKLQIFVSQYLYFGRIDTISRRQFFKDGPGRNFEPTYIGVICLFANISKGLNFSCRLDTPF